MAQFARPDADQATGSWTSTPLWSKVEEGVASADGTTVQSEAVGNNTDTSFADLRLSDVLDPSSSANHIIRARWRHNQSGRTMAAHAELWQGVPGSGTQIASLDVTPDVGTTLTNNSYTLSAGEADSITDYADLYIRLWGRGTGGGPSRSLVVDAVEFEVPDASTDRKLQVSAFEQEAPDAPRRVQVSAAELEAPDGANEVTDPNAFDSANWTDSNNIVTADDATAPDGSVTADLLDDQSGTAARVVFQQLADQDGTYHVAGFIRQQASGPTAQIQLSIWDGGQSLVGHIFVDPDTGNFSLAGTANTANGKVTREIGHDDYWRFSFDVTTPHVSGSGNPPQLNYRPATETGGTLGFDPAATGSNHFWGAEVIHTPSTDRKAQVSAFETEVPDAPRRVQVSAFEQEVPDGPRRVQVSAAELETPDGARRVQVSAFEAEVPNAPRRVQVSAFEQEVPDAPRRVQVSAFEQEIPNGPRRVQVSAVEIETPDASADRRAQVSAFETELPNAPRRVQVSAFEQEMPAAPRRVQVSAAELEAPTAPRKVQVSAVEMEAPDAPRRVQVSAAEFETPSNTNRRAQVSAFEIETPGGPRRVQVSAVELSVPEEGEVAVALKSKLTFNFDRSFGGI